MKFVMSLVLAATFATPAFAKDTQKEESKTVAVKNRADIKKALEKAKSQEKNAEEEKGAQAYRLVEIKDPNSDKGSKKEKTVTVSPWTGSNRQRILTPVEYEREEREGKYSTYAGSEVGKNYDTVYGAKLKIKFGGAKQ